VIQEGLNKYGGMKRRFEIMGNVENIDVTDDYAHHPTEIEATLDAAKNAGYGRVIAVFQPHLYSRTRDFLNEFAESLMKSDITVVTDIYKAREEPVYGVESMDIIRIMRENGHSKAFYIDDMYKISDKLVPMVEPNDIIILMGAGDIWKIGNELLKRIKNG
jgi:UDP-N-acetylmuramate--alanine ligase